MSEEWLSEENESCSEFNEIEAEDDDLVHESWC